MPPRKNGYDASGLKQRLLGNIRGNIRIPVDQLTRALRPDVAYLERGTPTEILLNGEIPLCDERIAEILIYTTEADIGG